MPCWRRRLLELTPQAWAMECQRYASTIHQRTLQVTQMQAALSEVCVCGSEWSEGEWAGANGCAAKSTQRGLWCLTPPASSPPSGVTPAHPASPQASQPGAQESIVRDLAGAYEDLKRAQSDLGRLEAVREHVHSQVGTARGL